jgi:hypothetical protein
MNVPNDHDLLIRLDEKVSGLITEVKKLTEIQNKRLDDHETRIRRLEKWVWIAIGGLTVIQIVVEIAISWMHH